MECAQRSLLKMVFGTGVLILAARAMFGNGATPTADRYYLRNPRLLQLSQTQILTLLFPGDIN